MLEQLLPYPAVHQLALVGGADEGLGAYAIIPAVLLIIGSLILGVKLPRLALPLSPFLSFGVSTCVIAYAGESGGESMELTAFAAGLVNLLVTLMAILASKVKGGEPNWAHGISRVVLIVMSFLAATGLLTAFMGVVGLIMSIALFAATVRYMLISRNTFCAHVFATLGAAMRQSLPLHIVLEAEAGALSGKWRQTMLRISRLLADGLPLSEALWRGYPACPGFALGQVAVAERIHQLPQAVAFVARQLDRRSDIFGRVQPVSPIYPFVLIFFACLVLFGLTKYVFPSYKMIFVGIGSSLPDLTTWFIDATDWFNEVRWFLLAAPFVITGVWLYVSFRRRDPRRPRQLSYVGDFLKWHLPILHWFEKNFALLQTVSILRSSLSAGSRVDQAIADAAELDMNLFYRQKIRLWLMHVQTGMSVSQAAGVSGVGKSLQWAFDQEANPGQTLSVLEMLENSYRCAYSYRANLSRLIFWPGVTIAMAAFVGAIVLALFIPLVTLIQIVSVDVIP